MVAGVELQSAWSAADELHHTSGEAHVGGSGRRYCNSRVRCKGAAWQVALQAIRRRSPIAAGCSPR